MPLCDCQACARGAVPASQACAATTSQAAVHAPQAAQGSHKRDGRAVPDDLGSVGAAAQLSNQPEGRARRAAAGQVLRIPAQAVRTRRHGGCCEGALGPRSRQQRRLCSGHSLNPPPPPPLSTHPGHTHWPAHHCGRLPVGVRSLQRHQAGPRTGQVSSCRRQALRSGELGPCCACVCLCSNTWHLRPLTTRPHLSRSRGSNPRPCCWCTHVARCRPLGLQAPRLL